MASRDVSIKVEFDYNFDGTYTDESSNVVSIRVERNLSGVGVPFTSSSGQISKGVITMRNTSNRFNSKISSGALYSDIRDGKFYRVPVKIYINTNGSNRIIFTGVAKASVESNKNLDAQTVSIDCYSNEELIKDVLVSTSVANITSWSSGALDSTVVDTLLTGYTKSIDIGSFHLVPLYTKQSLLSVLWNIADLSGAYFYSKADGTFKYKTLHSLIKSSSVLTITNSISSSINLNYVELDKYKTVNLTGYIYNREINTEFCSIPYIVVPANSTIQHKIEFSEYALSIDSMVWNAVSYGGTNYNSYIAISRADSIDGTTLTITNSHTTLELAVVNLKLVGTAYTKEKFTRTYTSTSSFWTNRNSKEKEITSDYLWLSTLDYVGNRLMMAFEEPIIRFAVNDLVTNTNIELFDLITITDTSLLDSSVVAFVSGISYVYSPSSGLRLNISAIDIAHIVSYYNTTPGGYFVLGTNKLGSTDALRGRLYL